MAIIYVRSTDGSDADNGTTWALAKATLAGAFAIANAGDTIYVSDNHAETQASSMTLTSPGTAANPVRVLCGDDAAEPPTALATTATISVTGNNPMSFVGFAYFYGIAFQAGSGSGAATLINFTSTSAWGFVLEACKLRVVSTSGSNQINVGGTAGNNDGCRLVLINTSVRFGATGQVLSLRMPLEWRDSIAVESGGTAPTTLFEPATVAASGMVRCVGCDFNNAGTNLVDVSLDAWNEYYFERCRLPAGINITTGSHPGPSTVVRGTNCDSGATNYRNFLYSYYGTWTQEATIVRTGGASDGTTPISRKMVSGAAALFIQPFYSDWVTVWNDATGGSLTATIEIVNDGLTLTDEEVWIEVDYLGNSSYPLASFVSDRKTSILASAANQTSSSETWTTTGLSSPVKQKLAASFTPQMKGPIRVRVGLARPSATVYFCPKVAIA